MLAVDMLQELGLPEDLIEDVRGMLGDLSGQLEAAMPGSIGAVFGGSDAGGLLSHHASLARQHVAEAVVQMADGLRGFRDELGGHVERMGGTDVQNAVDLGRINGYADCIKGPDFTAGSSSSCQAPTSPVAD
jgi:hypothetical protein